MIRARKRITSSDGTKTRSNRVWGPLFFGSIQSFNSKFDDELTMTPEKVEIDSCFPYSTRKPNHSAMEAYFQFAVPINATEAARKKLKIVNILVKTL